jgi:hypothetical protein
MEKKCDHICKIEIIVEPKNTSTYLKTYSVLKDFNFQLICWNKKGKSLKSDMTYYNFKYCSECGERLNGKEKD